MKKTSIKTSTKTEIKLPTMEDFFSVCREMRTQGVEVYDEDTDSFIHMEVDMKEIANSDYCNPDGIYREDDSLEYYIYGVFEHILKRTKDCDSYEVYCDSYQWWKNRFAETRAAGEKTPDDSDLAWFALSDALEYWISFDLRHLAEMKDKPNLKLIKN